MHNLFQDKTFRSLWAEYVAGKPSVLSMERTPNRWFFTEKQPMLKGMLSLRCLKTPTWYGWAEELVNGHTEQFLEFANSTDWHYASLYLMDSDANREFVQKIENEGFKVHPINEDTELWAEIPDGWENYVKGQSSSSRKILRNKIRRLENMDYHVRVYESDKDFEEFFGIFFEHHTAYWIEKQGFGPYEDARERTFFMNWCQDLRQKGQLRLLGFYVEGELATLGVNMVCEDALYFMVTVNTGAKQESGAGVLIQLNEMKEQCEKGIKRFYFGPGDYLHKRQASNIATKTRWVVIANPKSWIGKQVVSLRLKKQAQQEAAAKLVAEKQAAEKATSDKANAPKELAKADA